MSSATALCATPTLAFSRTFPIAVLALLCGLMFLGASPADAASKRQQECLKALSKGAANVSKAQNATNLECVKNAARGKAKRLGSKKQERSAQACLRNDFDGEVAKKNRALKQVDRKLCTKKANQLPAFSYVESSAQRDSAREASIGVLADLFGGNLDTALLLKKEDSARAACQAKVAGAALDLFDELHKLARQGVARGVAGRGGPAADSAAELEDAIVSTLEEDKKQRVQDAVTALDQAALNKCAELEGGFNPAFPGRCVESADAGAFSSCVAARTRCRFCEMLNDNAGLSLDCEDFDNGADDGSCVSGPQMAFVRVPPEVTPQVDVTVQDLGRVGFPEPERLASSVFEIGPDGTNFDGPVTIGIPIDPETEVGSLIEVLRLDEAENEWESLPGTSVLGGAAVTTTTSFSKYAAGKLPTGPGCNNVWVGNSQPLSPLHVVGGIQVTPSVKTRETIAFSGPTAISLGAEFTVNGCVATVSGSLGTAGVGDGKWVDYNQGGQTGAIPAAANGAFTIAFPHAPPTAPRGPNMGLADRCNATVNAFQYNLGLHFAADCSDRCQGVVCDDSDPCTLDVCNPGTGVCEYNPGTGACGSSGAGMCVEGRCVMEVAQSGGMNGNAVCAAEGLTCLEAPVLADPLAACLAFHPGATQSLDANGWRQGIYCADNDGKACEGRLNDCHHCPACNPGLGCTTVGSTLIESVFVTCQ